MSASEASPDHTMRAKRNQLHQYVLITDRNF
jgi:hypothetical protein